MLNPNVIVKAIFQVFMSSQATIYLAKAMLCNQLKNSLRSTYVTPDISVRQPLIYQEL